MWTHTITFLFTLFQWVYNILEGKSEQDRIIYDNKCDREGFVLLPDLKWDGLTKETLYLLAIVRQRGIKSLRDLTEEHLPLLKRVRDEGKVNIINIFHYFILVSLLTNVCSIFYILAKKRKDTAALQECK